jgi:hypothetical protein
MDSITTLKDFIINFINNSPKVFSSRLDKTLKAIINNYLSLNKENDYNIFITYLNKLRIIYYLKRLEYKDKVEERYLKG